MRLSKYAMPVVGIILLIGSVLVGQAAGMWKTVGDRQVALQANGMPDPEGIKGWMTLESVSEQFHIPMSYLYEHLQLPQDLPVETKMSEIEKVVDGFEVSTMRDLVSSYQADTTTQTADKNPEVSNQSLGNLAPVSTQTVETTSISRQDDPQNAVTDTNLHVTTGSGQSAGIRGRMSLAEAAKEGGVDVKALLDALGLSADTDTKSPMADIKDQLGFEVSDVREAVEQLAAGGGQ